MGLPYGVVDRIAKLDPRRPEGALRPTACKPGADLPKAYDEDRPPSEIVDIARPLEGLVRARLDPRRRRRDRRPAARRVPAAAAKGAEPSS